MHEDFKQQVWGYYRLNSRDFPWRRDTNPYAILVSEIMLQQTQADRVVPKFEAFMQTFPDINALAGAKQSDVLEVWLGLGYNRRALYLHQAAKQIQHEYESTVPTELHALTKLRGIGPNTAAAILVYAHNKPIPFIETNIRSVYIYHYFPDAQNVNDKDILSLVEETIDKENPREWYWALMDYGSYLKKAHKNPSRASKHHAKQSVFEGSDRQIRGKIVATLTKRAMSRKELERMIDDNRTERIIEALINEGFLSYTGDYLKKSD